VGQEVRTLSIEPVGRAFRTALVASLLLALASSSVLAQPSDADEKRRTQLFIEARKLADEGRFAEAVAPLREVLRIRSAPKALIALALVERELTHLLEARRLLEEAIAAAQKAQLPDDEAAAKSVLAELVPTIPRIDLEDADRFEGLRVFVDDQPAVKLDGRVLLDPGNRVVRLEAPGHPPQRETVLALVGRATTIYVALDTQKPAGDGDVGGDDTSGGGRLLPAFVGPAILGGTGVVAMGVGLTLMGLGSSDQSDARALCRGMTSNCPLASRPLAESGADKIIAGDVVFAVGGAFVVGGAVWLALELTGNDPQASALAPTPNGFALRF
jgi:tetratricopeptide (TPR) repeat protein